MKYSVRINEILRTILVTILTAIAFSFIIACSKDSNQERVAILEIGPTITMGNSNPPGDTAVKSVPYLTVKEQGSQSSYKLTTEQIGGFVFEEGYNYVIKVSIKTLSNPPADGSSESYKLVEIISKEKSSH